VGALLVVAAAAGVLATHRSAGAAPSTRYVVAAREVPAGRRLTRDDLGTLAIDLPDGVPAIAADDARAVVGEVATAALHPLDVVRPAELVPADRYLAPGAVEVPVTVDAARSLDDALHVGARVDVLATDPDATGTEVLARGVPVVAVASAEEGGIGAGDDRRVRLAAPDADTATRIVDAGVRSQLTLVLPRSGGGDG
jgi:Flp pilus assembly protein CpaB